jgi:8-hydroxy-5-deazaflavin:NADPH oxidoreductase
LWNFFARLLLVNCSHKCKKQRQQQEYIIMKIAIIGKGSVGSGLGGLFEAAGHNVTYVSARPCAETTPTVDGEGDVAILAVPYLAVSSIVQQIEPYLLLSSAGKKILVDVTNPLNNDWSPLTTLQGSSAGEEIQRLFPSARVVKAFNTIFADNMTSDSNNDKVKGLTAFIAGNDEAARAVVAELAKSIGFFPVETGPILTARYLEAMAHLNIQLAVGMGRGTKTGFAYVDGDTHHSDTTNDK